MVLILELALVSGLIGPGVRSVHQQRSPGAPHLGACGNHLANTQRGWAEETVEGRHMRSEL